ncbi:MAG: Ig-like domain-containing protein [Clostridium sp.]|nr:Ig-like domain-containing protein [Clostridium sp.]
MDKRRISILLAGVLLITILGNAVNTQAAAKERLSQTKVTITVGKSVTLKVKNTKKKVKWSTSNRKVAAVSKKGKVTGKKAGKATITAKVGGKKYTCKVTVKKKQAGATTEKSTEIATEENTERPTESTTEKSTEKLTEATTEESTEKPTETTTEATTEKSTETTTEENTEQQTTESQNGAPSADTVNYDAGEYSISEVHNGEGTFYDRVSVGAANLDFMEASYYTAAMNNEDYMNGLAGAYIEITDKDGDKINVVITDRLPEGKKGDIDLSKKAFLAIEPEVTGRMNITWKIIPFPTTEPISYLFKSTSTQYWAEVQVRNGRYPIKKLEYKNASGQYVELERQEYNYFTALSGMGQGPYTFRVTDFYGHVLEDTGIAMNQTETPVQGKANFPY